MNQKEPYQVHLTGYLKKVICPRLYDTSVILFLGKTKVEVDRNDSNAYHIKYYYNCSNLHCSEKCHFRMREAKE